MPAYWVREQGLTEVSVLMLAVSLPWSLKFFIAPLVDRYAYRKTWIVMSQLFIVGVLFILSLYAFSQALLLLFIVLISFLFAAQDVAQDAYAIEQGGGDMRP